MVAKKKTQSTAKEKPAAKKTGKTAKVEKPVTKAPKAKAAKTHKKWWLWLVIGLVILVALATAIIMLCKRNSGELMAFDGAEAETMTRDDGVKVYKGKIDLLCRIDSDTLQTETILLPDDEVETIKCRTDEVKGNFKLGKNGKLEIEYPKQDQEMAERKTWLYSTYKDLLPSKVEDYTRGWRNDDGKVSFYRAVDYMNEQGQPKYLLYAPDGGDEYTYNYKFSLYDKDTLKAIYELTVSVSLGDEGKKALEDFEDKADMRRAAVRSEMMSAAISPNYDELLSALVNHNSGRYSKMYLKFSGVVRVIEGGWLDGDACQLFTGESGYGDDVWVESCEINAVSLSEGDRITVIGIIDGDGLETFKSKGGTIRTIPRIKAYSVRLDNSQQI